MPNANRDARRHDPARQPRPHSESRDLERRAHRHADGHEPHRHEIDQKRQTLSGLTRIAGGIACVEAVRPSMRTITRSLRPARRRQSSRQIEILDSRQLLFRKSALAEFGHHRLPHFLPRNRSRARCPGRMRDSSAESPAASPARARQEQRAQHDFEATVEAGENRFGQSLSSSGYFPAG